MLSEKNSEISQLKAKYENDLAENDKVWKTRLEMMAQGTCTDQPEERRAGSLDGLDLIHVEGIRCSEASRETLEAQVQSLHAVIEEKDELIDDQGIALKRLTSDCFQHLNTLESIKNPYIDQIIKLKGIMTMQDDVIEWTSQAMEEAREEKVRLEKVLHDNDQLWQRERDNYLSSVRGLQNEIATLKDSLVGQMCNLQHDCSQANTAIQKLKCELKCTFTDNIQLKIEKDQLRVLCDQSIDRVKLDYERTCASARDVECEHHHALVESSKKHKQVCVEASELKLQCEQAATHARTLRVELEEATEEVTKVRTQCDLMATEHAQQMMDVRLNLAQAKKEHEQTEQEFQ